MRLDKWSEIQFANKSDSFLARSSQDVFLFPHIPWIEQQGSTLLVSLLYDLFDDHTILS